LPMIACLFTSFVTMTHKIVAFVEYFRGYKC